MSSVEPMSVAEFERPAEVFHVSEYIQEELTARGWSLDYLALRMALSTPEVIKEIQIQRGSLDFLMELREPSIVIGKESADALGKAFGVSPELFVNLHETWRTHYARLKSAQISQAVPLEGGAK